MISSKLVLTSLVTNRVSYIGWCCRCGVGERVNDWKLKESIVRSSVNQCGIANVMLVFVLGSCTLK